MKLAAALSIGLWAACSQPSAQPESKQAQPAPAKITQLYASPAAIARGDRSLLCYGVEGAASVRLEPAVEELAPSRARCIEVKPQASTKYTLYAKNRAGAEVSKEVEIAIDPKMKKAATASGLILFFAASSPKVPKGLPVTLCYGVKGASAVSVSPPVQTLAPSERLCFQATPQTSTSYVLTATSAAGAKDTETVRVTVE